MTETETEAAAAAAGRATGSRVTAEDVLATEPYRVWAAHDADVLDLCWSATQVSRA